MTADRDSALLRWLFLAPTMLGIGLFVVQIGRASCRERV